MKASHTLGPWKVLESDKTQVRSADHRFIADASSGVFARSEEDEANARVIAAVPDLLVELVRNQDALRLAEQVLLEKCGVELKEITRQIDYNRQTIIKAITLELPE